MRPFACVIVSLAMGILIGPAHPQEVELISVSSSGQTSNGASTNSSISSDGRWIAFESMATSLVPGDVNGLPDILLRDRHNSTTTRVSKAANGDQGNGHSEKPQISEDGRYILFLSTSTNLVTGTLNSVLRAYRYDRLEDSTELVSVSSSGAIANARTYSAHMSIDGRFITFSSAATNLVTNDTNTSIDVFVRDMATATTERVSLTHAGEQARSDCNNPSISANGARVAFDSTDSTLTSSDTNGKSDIFVRDRLQQNTLIVSNRQDGTQSSSDSTRPVISSDGTAVAFESFESFGFSTSGRHIFARTLATGVIEVLSKSSSGEVANASCVLSGLSPELRFCSFVTNATNLEIGANHNHSYVRDRASGKTVRSSRSDMGIPAEGAYAAISPSGKFSTFSSVSILEEGDANSVRDVYLLTMGEVNPSLQTINVSPASVRGGRLALATVALGSPASVFGYQVNISTANPVVASVPGSIDFAPGESSKQFDVTTSGVDADIDVVVSATGIQNSVQDLLTVRRATALSVSTALASIVGGNQLQGTVFLDGKAGPQAALVRMTDNSASLLMSTYCAVPANQSEANFTIWTYGVSGPTTVTISAYYNGTTKQTTLTLTPAALNVIWVVPTQVLGGNPSIGNVRLNGKAPIGGISVALSSSDPAVANMASSTTIAYGSDLKQFPITTFGVDLTKNVTITAVANGITKTTTLQVRPATLDRVSLASNAIQGGSGTTGTVHLTSKSGPLGRTVVLSSNRAEVVVPATMYIPPQRNSWSFAVSSSAVVSSVRATITASQGGLTRTVDLTVNP